MRFYRIEAIPMIIRLCYGIGCMSATHEEFEVSGLRLENESSWPLTHN